MATLDLLNPGTWPSWLVWFLAVYGLALLGAAVWEYFSGITGRRAGGAPLVSLLVVVANKEGLVEGAVRGFVSRYGYPLGRRSAYELVFVDDRSVDDTPRILRRLARRYPGLITVVEHGAADGGGAPSPVDAGLSACQGELVLLIELEALADPKGLVEAAQRLAGPRRGTISRLSRE